MRSKSVSLGIVIKCRGLLLIYAVFIAANTTADTQVIHAGTLLAVPGQDPLSQQTIVIENGKIVDVKDGFIEIKAINENAELIDLSSSFVMPGLMDMHVHQKPPSQRYVSGLPLSQKVSPNEGNPSHPNLCGATL